MEPVTGIEPALEEWGTSVLPLHHTGIVPVSPGCPAIRAKRALRLVTCTRTVNRHYKSSFCLAWLPTLAINSERLLALLVAGCRPLRESDPQRSLGIPFFTKRFPVKTERTHCPIGDVDTHSYTPWAWNHSKRVRLAITLPDGFWRCITLRFQRRTRTQKKGPLVAGFRPPRPRLSGTSKGRERYVVSRIEPSGQGIAPSHAPHMALALVGQAGIEPAVSCITMRMGATPRCPISPPGMAQSRRAVFACCQRWID